MAKKTTPIITYVEILNRAIHSIEKEIGVWNDRCADFPQAQKEDMLERATRDLRSKLDALKEMYHIETGTDYV